MNRPSLNQQVIVITGASSGIGLATALRAAKKGACLVLNSRNDDELKNIARKLTKKGCQVKVVAGDVADPDAMENLADEAVRTFGRIDTWINNAGVSIYGKLWETPLHEKRRLFDVNFWGVVHGCRAALKHMKTNGGGIINIGSVDSIRSAPIQGIYSASKHAVKAYTDALRMELEAAQIPIFVSLVKPASTDTPFIQHAQNHMDKHPNFPPPVYSPRVAARAILNCAVHPKRDVLVGGAARIFQLFETFLPRAADRVMEKTMMEQGQGTDKIPNTPRTSSLKQVASKGEGEVRGPYRGSVRPVSAYTEAQFHPWVAIGAAVSVGLGAGVLMRWLARGVGHEASHLVDRARGAMDSITLPYDGSEKPSPPWNASY